MSRLNIQSDLFLGLQELNRIQRFTVTDGFIRLFKSLVNEFGIAKVVDDTDFENFEVLEGTNTGTIQIAIDSYAVDDQIRTIYQAAIDNFTLTDDNSWYWVKISYQESRIEEGTVSVATNGDVTGVGTTFTEIFRDQSNYPVKINFPNSVLNTGDYQVVSVLSDTQITIEGADVFTVENSIAYQVVGAYTPGINPTGDDRLPYVYDSCNLELIAEVSLDTPPAKTAGEEFYLARVRRNGGSLNIEDKRTEFLSMAFTTGGWVQPTLNANFTNVTDQEVEYRINYLGEVEIRGAFDTLVTSGPLFTLPEGFRPAQQRYGVFHGDPSGDPTPKVFQINTSGAVLGSSDYATTVSNYIIYAKYQTDQL